MKDDVGAVDLTETTLEVKTLIDHTTGGGYDCLKFIRANSAIEQITPESSGQSGGDFNMWVATSARDLVKKMSAELDMRAYYMGAEAGVVAKLISNFEVKETSVIIIARQTIVARNLNIAGTSDELYLKKEALDRLARDPGRFHAKYGSHYCHTVVLGGELYVAYQCVMSTKKRADEVSLKIDGSAPEIGSLMANVSAVMKSESEDSRWQMTAKTQGAGGVIGDFDPSKPETVQKAVMDFMRDFEKNVRSDPEPYYGLYDAYWRYFEKAEPLKDLVNQADTKVEALLDWATSFSDQISTINSFLDPTNEDGYLVTDSDRKKLDSLRNEIEGVLKKLRDAYGLMELFEEFKSPQEIEGVGDHPPESYTRKLDNWRYDLLAHLVKAGQNLIIDFPDSGDHVCPNTDMMVGGAEGSEDNGPASGEYVRVSPDKSRAYELKSVNKEAGEYLCHDDIVKIAHTLKGDFKGQMIYMPDVAGIWTVRLAPHVQGDTKKYQWRIKIQGCKDTARRISTTDTLWLTNINDETCFLCKSSWPDYLGVTRDNNDEWKIKLRH